MAYNRQRNVCASSFRKAKRDYSCNLNPSHVKNTKTFWKTIKPLFSDQVLSDEDITLVGNDNITDECNKVLSDEHITLVGNDDITDECNKVSEIFSDFFGNAVKNFGIERINWELECDADKYNSDPVIKAIRIHENHPSVLKIKMVNHNDKSTFIHTTYENVYQEITSLNNSTLCPKDSIPANIIKENHDILLKKIMIYFPLSC